MRPDTKLKVARRKHTVELLRWLYSRRDAKVDGARLSLNHRERQEGGVSDSRSLTYGEVDVPDFLAILDIAKPRDGEVFVDLGSGTGKAVLASSCGFPEFSKCLGIELVQGLVEAAADHLRTAKIFLSEPRPTSHGTANSPQGNADNKLSTKDIAAETGTSPASSLGGHRDERLHRSAGGGGSKGGGRGGGRGAGGRNGKVPGSKAANSRGLSAADLEGLVADLLSRQPRPLPPPRPPQPLEVTGMGKGGDATARGEPETTAEEVASWLVRELGHRRYKDSLRGYGGLQKFLVARRKNIDGGAPSRLTIAEDGSKVSAASPEVSPPPVASEISRDGGMAIDGSEKADRGAGACCGRITGQDSVAPCRCAEEKDAATATDASAVVTTGAAVATITAAAAAAYSVTSAVSSASSDGEPSSDSALTSSPARTAASTVTSTSTSTSPSSSLSSSRVSSPAPPDKTVGVMSATLEVIARAPDNGGSSGCDSRNKGGSANGTERRRLPEEGPLTCESLSGVEMVCGDIFEEDWSNAGVVYVASLLFDDGMMVRLSKAAERLRQGARVISLRKIPTLTEGGEIPNKSERGFTSPIEGGEILSQSERMVPALIEGGNILSQSEPVVPAPLESGEIPSQPERVVPAHIEDGEIPSQSEGGDGGRLQDSSGSGEAPVRQPALRLLHEGVFRMSWQMARVYIYVRT